MPLCMNLFDKYQQGLPYADFIARYANDGQKQRWRQVHEQVALTAAQRDLLKAFRRPMPVLCLAEPGVATALISAPSSSTSPPPRPSFRCATSIATSMP